MHAVTAVAKGIASTRCGRTMKLTGAGLEADGGTGWESSVDCLDCQRVRADYHANRQAAA